MAHAKRIPAAKQVAIQGAPGTGKTRQGTALASLFARRFHGRTTEFAGQPLPTWAYRLLRNWRANPFTQGDAPRALPIAIVTPMRVTTTWESEVLASYPGAEVMMIDRWQDVDAWMARCAVSPAPIVVGVFSQSKTRAFSLEWEPAVITKQRTSLELVTSVEEARRVVLPAGGSHFHAPNYTPVTPADADEVAAVLRQLAEQHGIRASFLAAQGATLCVEGDGAEFELERLPGGRLAIHWLRDVQELTVDGKVAGYIDRATGLPITTPIRQSHFFCPDCGTRVEAAPDRKKKFDTGDDEEETLIPVTSITYFKKQQRSCTECGTELWQRCRTDSGKKRYPMPSFAEWSRAISHLHATDALGTLERERPARVGRGKHAPTAMQRIARVTFAQDEQGCTTKDGRGLPAVAHVECGCEGPSDFSPYEYVYAKYRGCVTLTELDECHNTRGTSTDIAHAAHLLCLASQRYLYASGTIYGGMLNGFYHMWYRFDPQFWKGLGLGWNDVDEAVRRYGVIQQIIKEHESDSRRGSGQTDVTVSTVPAPGISAKLLPRLLEKMVFIDTLDVGAFLPEKVEFPEVVDMDDPAIQTLRAEAREQTEQAEAALREARSTYEEVMNDPGATDAERADAEVAVVAAEDTAAQAQAQRQQAEERARQIDLAASYDLVEGTLEGMAKRMIQPAILAKGTLPRWWAALPCSAPPFTVTATRRGEWGDVLGQETLFQAPVLASDYLYPLERRLREIVDQELSEGRTAMIYVEQNDIRSAPDRLKSVLADHNPWVLPNNVEPEDREDAIRAAYNQGKTVFIVPYRRVSEGLNLQFLDTVIWFEMAQNLFHLEQSNLRIHRLGARNQKRMFYLVYRHTVAHRKLTKLGSQSGAAALFSGNTPTGALVKASGADKTTLARMSASLEVAQQVGDDSQLTDEELRAAFARRAAELNAALRKGRDWIGVTDALPERLRAARARQAAQAASQVAVAAALAPRVTPTAVATPAQPVTPTAAAPKPTLTPKPGVTNGGISANRSPRPPVAAGKIQFGNLDHIASTLKQQRKEKRAAREAQAQTLDLFSIDVPEGIPPAAPRTVPQQLNLLGL